MPPCVAVASFLIAPAMRKTLTDLGRMMSGAEKIAVLTCYDASFAHLLEGAGVDMLLVGDSLGMVLQGAETTLGVTMRDMVYHTRSVSAGSKTAVIMADMPLGSYQSNPESAYRNAIRLLAAGAHIVKLEGGAVMRETVEFLSSRGVAVCAHIGLTPQAVHKLGGYRVQGRDDAAAQQLARDAQTLTDAGASMILLEAVPAALAAEISRNSRVPTIGIGAGGGCSGQVLVLYDAIGIYGGKTPSFARNFMIGASSVADAVGRYVAAVKNGEFPGPEHSFR